MKTLRGVKLDTKGPNTTDIFACLTQSFIVFKSEVVQLVVVSVLFVGNFCMLELIADLIHVKKNERSVNFGFL